MITGFHKAKCSNCGHEFIVMEGGFVPNTKVCCPKCGTEVKSGFSSLMGWMLDIIRQKK